jgi:tyrosinase
VNLDLTPFWNGPETFWKSTSNAASDWTRFNQQYPEFVGLAGKTPAERRKAILDTVKQLYGPEQPFFTSAQVATGNLMAKASNVVSKVAEQVALSAPAVPSALSAPSAPSDANTKISTEVAKDDLLDWFVRVRATRFALGMTYTVLVFLGEPPASEAEWRSSSALVGYHTVFVSSRADLCSNCQAQAQNIDEGIVRLTQRLRAEGVLSKSEQEIEAYVRQKLRWRVQKVREIWTHFPRKKRVDPEYVCRSMRQWFRPKRWMGWRSR